MSNNWLPRITATVACLGWWQATGNTLLLVALACQVVASAAYYVESKRRRPCGCTHHH